MNLVQRQIFGNKSAVTYNTYIGGVSATISTASALATKLGISVGAISNFTIVGSDIKCRITGSYSIPANAFDSNTALIYFRDTDSLITSIGNQSFYGCINLSEKLTFNSVISIGSDSFTNCNKLPELFLPICTSIGSVSLRNCFALKILYSPLCINYGGTAGNDGVFNVPITGCKIYIHPSLATNNAGSPDGDIAYASSNGSIIRYVANFTAPSPITTLAAGTIYNTAVQLNFTAPSSTNAIDYYECYANGILINTIMASGQYIQGLLTNTNYDLTIKAVDVFLNRAVVSNTVNLNTTNVANQVDRSGLICYYKLDEISGTSVVDSWAGQNLTNSGIAINQTGIVNKSYLSTAGTQYLLGTVPALSGIFSLNIWCYRTGTASGNAAIFSQGDYTNGFGLWINSSHQITWFSNNNFNNYAAVNTTLSLNTWEMVTITYDGINVRIYVNSILKSTSALSSNVNTSTIRRMFNRGGTEGFIGQNDEGCIYNLALSQSQINNLYNSGNGITL